MSRDPKSELSDRVSEELFKQMGFGAVSTPLPAGKPPPLKELVDKAKGNKLPGKAARVRRTRRDKKKT